MLTNTLLNVETKLKKQVKLNDEKIKQLFLLLKKYKIRKFIYPGVITREVGIDIKETYATLGILADENYLERNYEIYCHQCKKFNGNKTYQSLAAIPEDICCDNCESDLSKINDTILIYRVVKLIE